MAACTPRQQRASSTAGQCLPRSRGPGPVGPEVQHEAAAVAPHQHVLATAQEACHTASWCMHPPSHQLALHSAAPAPCVEWVGSCPVQSGLTACLPEGLHPPAAYAALQDLENTIGSWDLYGQEATARYNSLQSEFFERAASGLTRREYLAGLIALGVCGRMGRCRLGAAILPAWVVGVGVVWPGCCTAGCRVPCMVCMLGCLIALDEMGVGWGIALAVCLPACCGLPASAACSAVSSCLVNCCCCGPPLSDVEVLGCGCGWVEVLLEVVCFCGWRAAVLWAKKGSHVPGQLRHLRPAEGPRPTVAAACVCLPCSWWRRHPDLGPEGLYGCQVAYHRRPPGVSARTLRFVIGGVARCFFTCLFMVLHDNVHLWLMHSTRRVRLVLALCCCE